MPISIFDNPTTLAEIDSRRKQIAADELGALQGCCDGHYDVREDDSRVKVHQPGCRHYITPDLYCGLAPMQQQRAFWDGNRTVIRQAQSPEAAFLQRLHLRIEAARPRSFWAPKQ